MVEINDDSFTERDVLRVLEVANSHLEEAEDVLWTAANQTDSSEHATNLETVTHGVWDAQHELMDLKRKLE